MTPTEQFLLDCLHADARRVTAARVAGLTSSDWESLLDLATQQRVRPLLLRRLTRDDLRDAVPKDSRETLTTSCRHIARANLELHAELSRLLRILHRAGMPVILLKGMHVASAVYGNLALREIGDMDIMVPRDRIERATELILDAGYAPRKPFSIDVDVAVSHHISVLCKPPRFAVELHWNITEPGLPHSIDPAPLWRRAVPVESVGAPALGLAREDLLLHLCQHVSYHHFFEFGMRSLCDVAEIVDRGPDRPQWDEIRARAIEWKWSRGVELALQLARDLLGRHDIPIDPPGRRGAPTRDIVAAAGEQLLRATPLSSRKLSAMLAPGVSGKARHAAGILFSTSDALRRQYPRVPQSPWIWWTVYVLRAFDLLHRYGKLLLQVGSGRAPRQRSTLERQRELQAYLLER